MPNDIVDSLVQLAAIAVALNASPQNAPEQKALDLIGDFLVRWCSNFDFDKPVPVSPLVYTFALRAADALRKSNPSYESTCRVFEALLAVRQGDEAAITRKLGALSDLERQFVVHKVLESHRHNPACLSPQARRALFRVGVIREVVHGRIHLLSREMFQQEIKLAVETLRGMSRREILGMVAALLDGKIPLSDVLFYMGKEAESAVCAALESNGDDRRSDIRYFLALLLNAARDTIYTLQDLLDVVRHLEEDADPPNRETILLNIGFLASLDFVRSVVHGQEIQSAIQSHISEGRLAPKEALELLDIAFPFVFTHSGYLAPTSLSALAKTVQGAEGAELIQRYAEMCEELYKAKIGIGGRALHWRTLKQANTSENDISASGNCELLARMGKAAALLVDLKAGLEEDPHALFTVLPRKIKGSLLRIFIEKTQKIDLSRLLDGLGDSWMGLTPNQRGFALWLVMFAPHAAQEQRLIAIRRALDGLSRDEVDEVLAAVQLALSYGDKALRDPLIPMDKLEAIFTALDALNQAAADLGAKGRLRLSREYAFHDPDSPESYIRLSDVDLNMVGKALSAALRQMNPDGCAKLGWLLGVYVPEPEHKLAQFCARWTKHMSKEGRVAFVAALPPRWRLALAFYTQGAALKGISPDVARQTLEALNQSERKLFALLFPARERKNLNMAQPDLAPLEREMVWCSLGVRTNVVLSQEAAEVPDIPFFLRCREAAEALARGHLPTWASAPTVALPSATRRAYPGQGIA